nr:uncharacterized protein LOC113724405 [Coffea arabica]
MSTHPESSDRPATTSPTDLTNLGAQLREVLNRFNELSVGMMAQRRVIDQLVASGASGEQHEPLPPGHSEPQPIFLPYIQTSVTSQVINPPEEVFTYPTHGPQPAFAPYIQTNPPHVQIPQNYPPITMSMPFEPQGPYYYSTAEPFTLDTAVQGKVEAGESSAPVDKNLVKRLDRFEEFIRKSRGLNKQGAPKFSKYDGTGNPKAYLRMFANKLGKPIDDENLPVRLFPESLEGDALDWYSNLKTEDMRSWIDLSTAFMRQYEYNCELAPTRATLEGTKRKPSEDHKTYAKRWRKLAAKVEPPMIENEIAGKIVNVSTLKMQLEALQGQNNSEKKSQFKGKEEETAFVGDQGPSARPRFSNRLVYSSPYPYYPNSRPIHHTTINHSRLRPNLLTPPFQNPQPNLKTRHRPSFNPRPIPPPSSNYYYQPTSDTQNSTSHRTFTNLGRPVDQLYEQLKAAGKIGVIPPKIYSKRFPSDYDPPTVCTYHSGAPGWPRIKPSNPLDITVQKFDGSDLINVNVNFKNEMSGKEASENVSKRPEWNKRSPSRIGIKIRNKKQLNTVHRGQYDQEDWSVITTKGSNHDHSDEKAKH